MKKINNEIIERAKKQNLEIGILESGMYYSIRLVDGGYTLANTLQKYKSISELLNDIEKLEYYNYY